MALKNKFSPHLFVMHPEFSHVRDSSRLFHKTLYKSIAHIENAAISYFANHYDILQKGIVYHYIYHRFNEIYLNGSFEGIDNEIQLAAPHGINNDQVFDNKKFLMQIDNYQFYDGGVLLSGNKEVAKKMGIELMRYEGDTNIVMSIERGSMSMYDFATWYLKTYFETFPEFSQNRFMDHIAYAQYQFVFPGIAESKALQLLNTDNEGMAWLFKQISEIVNVLEPWLPVGSAFIITDTGYETDRAGIDLPAFLQQLETDLKEKGHFESIYLNCYAANGKTLIADIAITYNAAFDTQKELQTLPTMEIRFYGNHFAEPEKVAAALEERLKIKVVE